MGRNDFHVNIKTHDVFVKVIEAVQEMSNDAVFPESIADLWEKILLTVVFADLRQHMRGSHQLPVLQSYLSKIGVRDQDTVDTVLWTLTDILRKRDDTLGVIADALAHFDKLTFNDAHHAVVDFLEKSNHRLVILMDSLEEMTLHLSAVSRALQGLLKFSGSLNGPRGRIDIRFCLPTELYHSYFLSISSNPNKDFSRTLWLQWISAELLMLGAQRLRVFLENYEPEFFQTIKHLKSEKRGDAIELFKTVLPSKIINMAAVEEESLPYILRHTQLLPRHFLILLNSIFSRAVKGGDGHFPIEEKDILTGIRVVEGRMAREILAAYSPMYPTAYEVCRRCIPELSHRFTYGDLQTVFNTHGKKVSDTNDFFNFKRMLMEIGIVGRVVSETDMYVKGLFEYTVPNELLTNTLDDLCIHPLFSGVFASRTGKPVYPYGVIEDDDYREPF